MDDPLRLREWFTSLVGPRGVVKDKLQILDLTTDRRKRYVGQPLLVLKPATTSEVAEIVKLAAQTRTAVVPQGGNTGLCGGATPDASGAQIVVNLTRMNQIRAIDSVNNTMTVEAGCVLADVQHAAAEADRLFPLSLAAEGSCTIGGNVSTNAGGVRVLRYGMMRDVVLGIEVVLPSGEIWHGLRGLRKDNTGYDLKHLFVGAEGTLGVITAVTLKLFPRPTTSATMLIALDTPGDALQLLSLAQSYLSGRLTAFELISATCLTLVRKYFPSIQAPFPISYPQYALIEISDTCGADEMGKTLEVLLSEAHGLDIARDVAVGTSRKHIQQLWQVREYISEAETADGKNVKHDISLPISRIADFIEVTDSEIAHTYPGTRMICFGHLGDGSLHYNVAPPQGADRDAFMAANLVRINRIVHDSVTRFGGSISAEHGLGQAKREEILRYKTSTEMNLMRAVKNALDPLGIMNPGKVL
jgi:FAD/FMN-containing dehydrogenase